ncbi:LamG domain-containing protein [Flavobacterium selenitireducens]|uniref:LamG domain-containing protein n=1 Tax=Flavobacterium selenitireducens TaxID=2722704 RepID=UPI00168B0B99|nr:LamG domain-containing protein [Flavobacterium selenitireducens]MBD3582442.1 LamG domain-containing protein [Flavobacterium selenitireducens]
MKNFIRFSLLFSVIALGTLFSCQDEERVNNPGTASLDKNALLTQKLQSVTANNTSIDNVIDSTDCFTVKLPVQVLVNGQTVTVASADEYAVVEEILESTSTGGTVDFVYPITLITASYEEIPIANESQFVGAVSDCAGFEAISCIAFDFPVTLSIYDTGSQNPFTVAIDSNQEFYLTLMNLQEAEVYQIQYPVTANNGLVVINDNTDLDNAISSAIADCACEGETILSDGLILYLTFANEVKDLTEIANSQPIGEIQFTTDRSDNANGAISFLSGSADNQVVTPGNPNNDMLQDGAFTVSIWFNRQTPNFDGPAEVLFRTNLLDIVLEGPNPEIRSPKVLAADQIELVDQDWIEGQLFGQIGVWHHLVVVYDGSVLSLYRDGELRAEQQMEFPQSMMSPNFVGGDFRGFIDDVRVYKRALEIQEILQLYGLDGDVNTCLD